jgi:integrase
VNRNCNALRAALNLMAKLDPRISNSQAWETGLASVPDAHESRNVILPDEIVRAIVAAAYTISGELGLMVEVCAVTGARLSQVAQLRIADLQNDRLMMMPSRKGRGKKRIERRPVPIPQGLVAKLRAAAEGRPAEAPLLLWKGEAWPHGERRRCGHQRLFRRAVEAAGLDPSVTLYALRHSSIVRMLLAGVPLRVVASCHDTSVLMIEKTYSTHILDHSDALMRRGLLDVDPPPTGDNVLTLRR